MKSGFSTTCTIPANLETSFMIGQEAGFDGIEVMIMGSKLTRDAKYLQDLSDKYALPILSLHAPTLLLTHFVWGKDPAVKLEKSAELAAELNVGTVVVHPPYAMQKQYASIFLDLVQKVEKNTGVIIAVENMFPWRVKNREVAAYAPSWDEIIETVPHLTYDFSHASLSGWNSYEILPKLVDKIAHIHLCDGVGLHGHDDVEDSGGKIFDEHLLPGMGNQRVAECLQLLKAAGWDGNIVAEINTKTARNNVERYNMLNHVAQWTDSAWNG